MAEPSSKTQPADSGALLPRNSGEDAEEDGTPGALAGVCEAFMLLWCIPGFGLVALFSAVLSGGATLAWLFVFPNLEKKIWGCEGAAPDCVDNSASNVAWMNAGRCLVSVLLCAHFGSWSDKNSRKAAVVVMTVASLIPGLPVLVNDEWQGMTAVVILVVITGPFAVHVSGSPVLWAWASDYLGPEHKEVGFAIIGACSSAGSFVVLIFARWLATQYPGQPAPFLWINVGCLIVALIIVAFTPPGAYMPDLTEEDIPEEKGILQAMFGPMRLVAKKPVLRATCVVVALLTLPDMAATDISSQIIFAIIDIQTPCIKEFSPNVAKITECAYDKGTDIMTTFSVYPRPLTVVVVMVVGVCARRFGPHRLVRVWVPITAIMFAFPVVLISQQDATWALLFSGFFTLLPLTNYGPLQALVTHIVHPRQVGEAMGAIATCKNMVSLLAPILIGVFTEYLANIDRNDLLWVVYPACAVVMLCAWPFTFCLEKRVARDTITWSTWASAARPSTIRSALNARSSAMFSARP